MDRYGGPGGAASAGDDADKGPPVTKAAPNGGGNPPGADPNIILARQTQPPGTTPSFTRPAPPVRPAPAPNLPPLPGTPPPPPELAPPPTPEVPKPVLPPRPPLGTPPAGPVRPPTLQPPPVRPPLPVAPPEPVPPSMLARAGTRIVALLLSAEALVVAGAGVVIAVLVVPSPNKAPTRPAGVEGQPDLQGTVDQGLGTFSGLLTIRRKDAGSGGVELWLDVDQSLRTKDGSHDVVGHLGTDGVHLTPEGEAYVLKRLGMESSSGQQPSPAPQVAVPPGQTAPAPAPQVGTGYEVRDQAERDIVADLAAQGIKDNQSIQNALEEHRRKAGGVTGPGITTGMGTGAQADGVTGKAPDGSPESPFSGPDMTPVDRRERGIVEKLKREGASDDDIRKELAASRAKYGAAAAAGRRSDGRNRGLPDELTTSSGRAQNNVVDSDPKLRDAIKTNPDAKPGDQVVWEDFVAHHLIPMEAVRKHKDLFEAAARAGWNPDEIANVIGLPRTEEAQRRMGKAMGERRPIHDSGHGDWNKAAGEAMQKLRDEMKETRLPPGPAFDEEVRRRLEQLQSKQRGSMPSDRLTMLDVQDGNAA